MGFTLPRYKIDNRILSALFIFLICLIFSEPFSLPIPIIENSRKLIPPISIIVLSLSLIDSSSRSHLLDVLRSRLGVSLSIWALVLCVGLVVSYEIDSLNSLLYILLSITCFFSAYSFSTSHSQEKKFISNTMVVVTLYILSISFISVARYFFPIQSGPILEHFYTDKAAKYMLYDNLRTRIYPVGNIDYTLALASSSVFSSSPYFQVITVLVAFTALLLSNYRGRIMIGLISFMLTILIKKNRYLWLLLLTLIATAIFSIFLNDTNFFTRYSLQRSKDVDTIVDRLNYVDKALSLFIEKPILGVGLGNYSSYSNTVRLYSTSTDYNESVSINSYENPHNFIVTMLVETGILGVLPFLVIISFFIYIDSYLYKNLHQTFVQLSPFIISSWCLIAGSLIDWYDPHHLIYFMIVRGYIYGKYKKQTKA